MNASNSKSFYSTIVTLVSLTIFAISSNVLPACAANMGMEFGLSEPLLVQRVMPVQFLGFTVLCFLGGWASDRFGKRWTLICGSLGILLGSCIWRFAGQFPLLLLGALILGMGGGIIEGVASAALTDLHPTRGKLIMNISQVFYCLGAISIGSLVGFFLAKGVGWRTFYMMLTLLGALLTAGFLKVRYPQKASEQQLSRSNGEQPAYSLGTLMSKIWLPSFCVFLYVFSETSLYAFGPNYMKLLGAGETIATFSIATFWFAVVIGRIACSFLPQKQSYEKMICAMFLLAFAATFCQVFVKTWGMAMAMLALSGLGCAGIWPMLISMIATRNFEQSGAASGIAIAIGAIGCIVSPMLLGWVFDNGNTRLAFFLLSLCFLLGCLGTICTYFQYRRQLRQSHTK